MIILRSDPPFHTQENKWGQRHLHPAERSEAGHQSPSPSGQTRIWRSIDRPYTEGVHDEVVNGSNAAVNKQKQPRQPARRTSNDETADSLMKSFGHLGLGRTTQYGLRRQISTTDKKTKPRNQ